MYKHTPSFSTHLEKYVFASNYVARKKVLDVGCNIGYGTHILSYGARSILAIDNNPKAIKIAEKSYHYFCSVAFDLIDLEKDFPKESFDVIVMFDVIEHVVKDKELVTNAYKALNKGGLIIFSIPKLMPAEDHKKLYDKQDIYDLFNKTMLADSKLELFEYSHKPITGKSHYKYVENFVGICHKPI